MAILTNCLSETPDEGALKVANTLIRRIKEKRPDIPVVSYERSTQLSDVHFSLNKLMLNLKLWRYLRKQEDELLYIPFPARMIPIAARTLILSLFTNKRIKVVLIMQEHIGWLCGLMLKMSRAETISISKESWEICKEKIGSRAKRLKVGVDTDRFRPVSGEQKKALRKKYGIPDNSQVVLHVGHMKEGRNLQQLLKLDSRYSIMLVTSTFTANEQEHVVRQQLENRKNLRIADTYFEHIEEIYQVSDAYFFPVERKRHCIDAPLSVFEAAACNVPCIHTAYGELTQMENKEGFYTIQSFEAEHLNELVGKAIEEKQNPRKSVLEYDWKKAVEELLE